MTREELRQYLTMAAAVVKLVTKLTQNETDDKLAEALERLAQDDRVLDVALLILHFFVSRKPA